MPHRVGDWARVARPGRAAGRITGLGLALSITIAAALAWSATSVVYLLVHVIRHGGILSGSDGPLAGSDQFLYMDFIRQSGSHLLIRDNFDLTAGGRVYLQPLYLLDGILWRTGLSIAAAFWSLKLIAAPVLAVGIVTAVARCLARTGERVAASLLALFYMSPLVPLLAWSGAVSGLHRFELDLPAADTMPAWQLWGYLHSAIAMGLMALAIVWSISLAEGARSWRLVAGTAACACLAAWLHPWQGAIFLAVLGVLIARARSTDLVRTFLVPALAVLLPLAYLAALPHLDAGWRVLSAQNGAPLVPAWMIAAALAPLVIPALFGFRAFEDGPLLTTLMAWPLATFTVFLVSPQFRYHALQGITIPLAILAVAGWRRMRFGRALAIGALALAVLSGPAYELSTLRDSVRSGSSPYWFTADQRHALGYLEHSTLRGGVLSSYYLGMAVPAYAGRRTWMGETTWTPHFTLRRTEAEQAFAGQRTIALIRSVAPRFVLTDCGSPARVNRAIATLAFSTRRFGCVTVFQVPDPGTPHP